jgi:hypothetical protein
MHSAEQVSSDVSGIPERIGHHKGVHGRAHPFRNDSSTSMTRRYPEILQDSRVTTWASAGKPGSLGERA